MTGKSESKTIAPNVNKTGYAKIAQLVDMPSDADLPQCDKEGWVEQEEEEEEEEEGEDLNITKNPQSVMPKAQQ